MIGIRVIGRLAAAFGGLVGLSAVHAAADPSVEIDPDILRPVRDRTYLIPESEREAYYQVLQHARRVDAQNLQAAAREHRLSRIRQAARPGVRDDLLERPETFPVFVDLFRNPEEYRGKPVTLRGYARKLISYPADDPNEHGIETLYEAWIFTEDSQGNPAVVVCTEVPDGMPRGDNINEQVSVTGYFFKMYGYPARDTTRVAPMILADRLVWYPARGPAAWRPSPVVYASTGAGVLGLIAVVWWLSRGDRQFGRRRIEREGDDAAPDFSAFDRE